ncbi:MAG: glycosyltransferase family 9 protein [bacterium]|nr:glycosyltransferase family 9 protein [bacterium]
MAGENNEIKSCLIRFSSLGDVLLTLPLIGPLAEATGGEIAFITRESYNTIVERHPDIGAVYTIPARGDESDDELGGLVDAINAELDTLNFAADIHGVTLSRRVLKRISAKETITYQKDGAKRLLLAVTGIDLLPKPTVSVVEKYAQALGPAGVSGSDSDYRMSVDGDVAAEFRKTHNIEPDFIAIAPRARYETKSWQREGFTKVIEILGERGVQVVLFDEKSLDDWVTPVAKGDIIDISGKTPLRIFPEALSGAAAVICNDSAIAHLAPLLGIPVVGIFGPTSPRFGFAPRGKDGVTLYDGYPCSPCTRHGKRKCWRGDKACMSAITPGQVMEALDDVIGVA